jgi:hypothetical protein
MNGLLYMPEHKYSANDFIINHNVSDLGENYEQTGIIKFWRVLKYKKAYNDIRSCLYVFIGRQIEI